jgi:PTH2 family peptidyl-tRNA hydrolase
MLSYGIQMMKMEHKMVIAVRSDLKLSPGKMAAQVAHAAVNCALASEKNKPDLFKKWHAEGAKKVVVKVQNLEELFSLKVSAEDARLITSLIVDAGHTELPPNTTTCLGIGPAPDEVIDRVTGHLGLM